MKQRRCIFLWTLLTLCLLSVNLRSQTTMPATNTQQTPQGKYGLFGKLVAKKDKGDELLAILLEAAKLVSSAKGCHIYLVSKDPANAEYVWVSEVWDSQEDHDNSLKNAEVLALIKTAIPLVDGKPEAGLTLEVMGGKGIE